ncbi:hypothetical protein E2C01_096069 [Portunus trituberculatus]|uniref:Uncharacterized protein n=1 Tax=Portunus trituberculatus TaxID=210409 RepID=A0A5B7K230_PORTR|nr:hypothetical protein [Portunus trituberculatus]
MTAATSAPCGSLCRCHVPGVTLRFCSNHNHFVGMSRSFVKMYGVRIDLIAVSFDLNNVHASDSSEKI